MARAPGRALPVGRVPGAREHGRAADAGVGARRRVRRRQRILRRRTQQQFRAARVLRAVGGTYRRRRPPAGRRRPRRAGRLYVFGIRGARGARPAGVTMIASGSGATGVAVGSIDRAIAVTVAPLSMSLVTTITTGPMIPGTVTT